MGDNVKEVLPTTTVTEANRDGLFGRIPRRVLEDRRWGLLLEHGQLLQITWFIFLK